MIAMRRLAIPILMALWWLLVMAAGVGMNRVYGQTDAPLTMCLPGFYGKQWPGSDWSAPTRTDNGWYAFAFCDGGDGRLVPRRRVCAHGECLSQDQIGSKVGQLLSTAFASSSTDKAAIFEASPDAQLTFSCPAYDIPANGVQPFVPAPPASAPTPLPVASGMRAAICADSAAAMKAVWPKVAIVTPPPPAACAAQAVVWGLCNAPYAGGASGSSIQLADTTAPDTGTVTVACTNGALAQTLASCVTVVPPPPGAPVWEVTPNGTTPTRPTYPAIQGTDGKWKRASTSSNARVNTLTVCDCAAIDVFEFNITHYCKVPVDPAPQVAACRLRK